MNSEFITTDYDYQKASPLSQNNVREFIDIYRQHPCLWKLSHPDNKNSNVKYPALLKLLECIRKEEPDANMARVKLRISNMRTSFKREMRKVELSKKKGGSVYYPKLWYFGMLWFILEDEEDNEQIRTGLQGSETQSRDEFVASASSDTNRDSSFRLKERKSTTSESSKSDGSNASSPSRIQSPVSNPLHINTQTRSEICNKTDNALRGRSTRNKLYNSSSVENPENDEFDLIGRVVAAKLRKLPDRERIIAEKLIHEVLCQAQLGRISLDSNIVSRSN